MQLWRNWQTRTFEGRVGNRMGSSPISRTKINDNFLLEDCRFFVLLTFLFSIFSLLSNCRFRRKDKREEKKGKVALLRKASTEGRLIPAVLNSCHV